MRKPYGREFYVPVPSPLTVFFRTFLPWQLIRFIRINLKMVQMIWIGDHGKLPVRVIQAPAEHPQSGPA